MFLLFRLVPPFLFAFIFDLALLRLQCSRNNVRKWIEQHSCLLNLRQKVWPLVFVDFSLLQLQNAIAGQLLGQRVDILQFLRSTNCEEKLRPIVVFVRFGHRPVSAAQNRNQP